MASLLSSSSGSVLVSSMASSFYRCLMAWLCLLLLGALPLTSCLSASTASTTTATSTTSSTTTPLPKPIVYTIAGSDSGGGAGIQADLHALHSLGAHGCSAVTCLTAQNSCGVVGVHAPPPAFLQQQLDCLVEDLPPVALKIGMLGTRELTLVVGETLQKLQASSKPWVVLDPVMISTSGSKLLDDDAIEALKTQLFPLAHVLTPNKFEAEALVGRELHTPKDVEMAAKELLEWGCKAVLIKGGHTLVEEAPSATSTTTSPTPAPTAVQSTLQYAQDYLLSAEPAPAPGEERLCDASRGVWLRTKRWDSDNTHGTGCTLSSSMAAALALGEQQRQFTANKEGPPEGATAAIHIVDACCLAKAYVSAGIQTSVRYGQGPGPVAQTRFPDSYQHFPSIVADPTQPSSVAFPAMKAYSDTTVGNDDMPTMGRILPIVDSVEWVERLAATPGITDIQLRIKDEIDPAQIVERVKHCQKLCASQNVRLWINDYWQAALEAGCFGVHVGQEDLVTCQKAGGLEQLRSRNIALGISTHSYGELAAALGIQPTYISLGPVFATSSKKVQFEPQGLEIVQRWRKLIPPHIPFVTIGGINDVAAAKQNREAGSDCVALIGAVTGAEDVPKTVAALNEAMK